MADDASFPTGADVIDANRNGQIGRGAVRVDGWAKVTGAARYAYETREEGPALYGVAVVGSAGLAKVRAVRLDQARAAPGVRLVWGPGDGPAQAPQGQQSADAGMFGVLAAARPQLDLAKARFSGDTVAMVVADTFENARAAAALVQIDYDTESGRYDFEAALTDAQPPKEGRDGDQGDFDSAFDAAPVRIDSTFVTPIHNHAQMEPHASLAVWEGDRVTVHTSTQLLKPAQQSLAETLMIPRDHVRVVSRYIGGGFGGKLYQHADAVLAALAARELGAPVKVALTRQQTFSATSHRSATVQRVRLGADRDGRLVAISHEGINHHARDTEFLEGAPTVTRSLYAAPNRRIRHTVVPMDIPPAGAVRAPGEAVGMLAIEVAMDELAETLGMDPIDLRVLNEPEHDPDTGKPFGSRSLVACMQEGAARFGWERRGRPGEVRDGRWLVGLGMSASMRANFLLPAKAEIRLNVDGRATVRQAMTDIGTGTYTILAQIAAEALGIPVEDVIVEIGDSSFPPAPGSGGSFGAASAGSALLDATMVLRRDLAERAVADPESPLFGGRPQEAIFVDGAILIGNRAERLPDLMRRVAPDGLQGKGSLTPPGTYNDHSQHAHGAHFAEVGVDRVTGEVRLRRMLGVFAAGRILNAQTARSQALGGMIWGVGSALTEENHVDSRYGSFGAQDLASYHVPAHADIADLDAVFIAERDDHGNPMKIKGVGELGICGAGAAVANAIYNACGARLRDYPMTLDKVLASGALDRFQGT